MQNAIRTAMLLGLMMALFGLIGLLLGGGTGMIIALAMGAMTNLFAFWNADRLALRAHNAIEVDHTQAPELVEMVHGLADRANMPRPRVFVVQENQPNAFATGRNAANGAVAVTTGLMDLLSREELAGVIAHELAHIKNRDTLTMTVAATLAGAISSLINFAMFFGGSRERPNIIAMLMLTLLAPMAAGLIQMAISRAREYEADHDGADICGNPVWLASALQKIAGGAAMIPNESAEQHKGTAPMFIINPLSGRPMDGLFTTHPRTENRIAALMQQAERMGAALPSGESTRRTSRGPWG